jgi:hypothetical protein
MDRPEVLFGKRVMPAGNRKRVEGKKAARETFWRVVVLEDQDFY